MKHQTTMRLGCAATAAMAALTLSACQPETVSGATTPPGATTGAPAPSAGGAQTEQSTAGGSTAPSDTGSSDTTQVKRGPDGGSPEKGTAPNGMFGVDGGYLVDGSKVTFVYNNGVRETIDVGQPITDPTHAKITTDEGTLTLTPTRGSWTTDSGAATVVDRHGAGTIVGSDGLIVVLAGGTSTCANASGLQFVGSDGRKGSASKGGLFYLSQDGKKTTFDAPSSGGTQAGQFTVCGVDDEVSMDLFSDVLFDFDESTLTSSGKAVVESAAATIEEDVKGKTVQVTGHTDSKGTPASNQRLGMARAQAVAAELKKRIPGLKVEVASAGQSEPIAANTTAQGEDLPDGRAKNRRVTITYTR